LASQAADLDPRLSTGASAARSHAPTAGVGTSRAFTAVTTGSEQGRRREVTMYIGIGTIVVIVIIVLLVLFLRRA
jgi:uncharacterized membrane protein YidH (DUF202 family)